MSCQLKWRRRRSSKVYSNGIFVFVIVFNVTESFNTMNITELPGETQRHLHRFIITLKANKSPCEIVFNGLHVISSACNIQSLWLKNKINIARVWASKAEVSLRNKSKVRAHGEHSLLPAPDLKGVTSEKVDRSDSRCRCCSVHTTSQCLPIVRLLSTPLPQWKVERLPDSLNKTRLCIC